MDSDDYLLVEDMADIVNLADSTQTDIIRGLVKRYLNEKFITLHSSSTQVIEEYKNSNKYAEIIPNYQFLQGCINFGFSPKIWSGFYRTCFLRDNQCYFPDVCNAEDEYFELKIFSASLDIKILEISLSVYFYRENMAGISKSFLRQFKGTIAVIPLMLEWCEYLETQINQLSENDERYYNALKLLLVARFISLRLNVVACVDLYSKLTEEEQKIANKLITTENIRHLDEYKYMILAYTKESVRPKIYQKLFAGIKQVKELLKSK